MRLRYDGVFPFRPRRAASAPGSPTPGLTSGAVSHRGQGKVPRRILVEGITCTPKGALPMKGFVLSRSGEPLMPTTPRRARLWLKAGKARVLHRDPFTIQLSFETTGYTQPVTVGVDTGSQTVGIAAITKSEVVYQAEVYLRTDITKDLLQRRQYRPNRRRSPGWLPPSLWAKVEATVKAVRLVASVLPVYQIKVEVGSFDTQRMQNPEISGLEYHQGQLQGYHLREYLFQKWQRCCSYCGASGLQLQIEHIVPKARGGSDRASNLALACLPCNLRKGNQTAVEFGFPQVQAHAQAPLKDATHVSSVKTAVVQQFRDLFGPDQVTITMAMKLSTSASRCSTFPNHTSMMRSRLPAPLEKW